MTDVPQFVFKRVLADLAHDKIIVPIIRAALLNPKFKGFTLKVEGWTPRPYDGKFHPSTHASWHLRQLVLYLTQPELLEEEVMELTSVLAITQGKFWHTFMQRLLKRNGILVQDEVPIDDAELNVVGHMDGVLKTGEGFEFKSMNDFKLPKVMTWEDFRDLCPEYWDQLQTYLMITGLKVMRVVIMSAANPYTMVEFSVPANRKRQAELRQKYLLAQEMAADNDIGEACCALGSKEAKTCPVRNACPIGRMTAGAA